MEELYSRALLAGLYSLIPLLDYGISAARDEKKLMRYSPLASDITFVPFFFLLGLPLMLLLLPKQKEVPLFHAALQLLPQLFVFTLLLLALSGWLRNTYTAQGCADLLILPGFLTHIFMFLHDFGPDPWLTLRLPQPLFRLLLGLWLAGACTVMLWKTAGHFRFRRAILRAAKPAPSSDLCLLREVWKELVPEKRRGHRLPKLLRSSAVSAPLTIGLFPTTTRLVLPVREYSREELFLIFRHESIHLLHDDNVIKFSTVFLCAAGWFIPSFWLVMKRASEDLELCCDELATADLNELGQGKYARLLLDNAGTEIGFTTCLSASANGLRYRLRRITQQKKGQSAVLPVVLLTALFVFFYGTVGLELDVGTLRSELLDGEAGTWQVVQLVAAGGEEPSRDPALLKAATDCLPELRLTKPLWVEWKRDGTFRGNEIFVTLQNSEGSTAQLCLSEDKLYFYPEGAKSAPEYRIIGDFDPEELRSLAEADNGSREP